VHVITVRGISPSLSVMISSPIPESNSKDGNQYVVLSVEQGGLECVEEHIVVNW